MLTLTSPTARATVDVDAGGRLASLVVAGRELLVTSGPSALEWGSYPMVPFAGRVRRGVFRHAGREWRLPLAMPPHAIHGFVFDRPWRALDGRTIEVELGDPWPFAGRARQSFDLGPDTLRFRLDLEADEPMPASIGWHPWFARQARKVDAAAAEAPAGALELEFEARAMYERDDEGIPTGRLVAPKPRPWDDCFIPPLRPPVLRWQGFLELTVESDLPAWVVYDEPAHAICVEPQTAIPDALNLAPRIVEPGAPLVAEMTWRWRSLGRPSPAD